VTRFKPKAFAEGTDVPVERSRAELEQLLHRYGATSIGMLRDTSGVVVVFEMAGRRIRQTIEQPDPEAYKLTPGKLRRNPQQIAAAVDQELKRRWRALLLITKAKLELVASGGSTFAVEYMAHTVLPNGATMAEAFGPVIDKAYKTGEMPPLRLGSGK
jgi:hypothetical protein